MHLPFQFIDGNEAVGTVDGFAHDFDAVRLAHLLGEHGRQQPAAAVCVYGDGSAAFEGAAHRALVQLAADATVDLYEGVGPHFKADAELVGGVLAAAAQEAELFAEYPVPLAGVTVLPEGEGLELSGELFDQQLRLRQRFGGGDRRDNEVPLHVPHDDVAEGPAFGLLVIPAHARFLHIRNKGGDDLFRPIRVDGATLHGDDAVAALGIEADDRAAVFIDPHGDL